MDDPNEFADQVEADLSMHNAEDLAHQVDAHMDATNFYRYLESMFDQLTERMGPLEDMDQVESCLSVLLDLTRNASLCPCAIESMLANLLFHSLVEDGHIKVLPETLAEMQGVNDLTEEGLRALCAQRFARHAGEEI